MGGWRARSPLLRPRLPRAGRISGAADPGDFDGPGQWQWLCLEHVREHNAKYNYFEGMSPDEIEAAQSPIAGWDRATRAFAHAGSDPGPAWREFADPLDAIAPATGPKRDAGAVDRFTAKERHALAELGLKATRTSTGCASAIRNWSAAIIPTATAATAAMKRSWAGDRGLAGLLKRRECLR